MSLSLDKPGNHVNCNMEQTFFTLWKLPQIASNTKYTIQETPQLLISHGISSKKLYFHSNRAVTMLYYYILS